MGRSRTCRLRGGLSFRWVKIRGGRSHTFGSQMAMAGADPFAIMKAMGHADIKTTMIYVSLGKSHIREQVERLNTIHVPRAPAREPYVSEIRQKSSALRLV